MSNYTYTCEICNDSVTAAELAYSEPRSTWEDGDDFHICNNCYASSMIDDDGDDSYVFASIGWGTDEDYGYYGD